MSIFTARISRGRTVRELCFGMVLGLTASTDPVDSPWQQHAAADG